MPGPVPLLVGALAVLALLVLAAWLRRRALVRAPGAFDVVVLDADGRRTRLVARYDRTSFWLTGRWFLSRVRWRCDRRALEMSRLPGPGEPGRVLVALADVEGTGAAAAHAPLRVEVDEADAGALRAWAEAAPSRDCRSWWHAPGEA